MVEDVVPGLSVMLIRILQHYSLCCTVDTIRSEGHQWNGGG